MSRLSLLPHLGARRLALLSHDLNAGGGAQIPTWVAGTLIDAGTSLTPWTAQQQGSMALVMDDPDFPDGCIEFTSTGAWPNYGQFVRAIGPLDARYHAFSYKVKRMDNNMGRIAHGLSHGTSNFNTRFEGGDIYDSNIVLNRVHRRSLPMASLFGGGNDPTADKLEDVRHIRLQLFSGDGGTCKVRFGDLRFHETPAPSLVFLFDDGKSDTYSRAFPTLQAAGFVGTIALETGNIGAGGYCTLAQLNEMHAAGWQIVSHTVNGLGLNTSNPTPNVTQLANSKAAIVANWPDGQRGFVYPGGVWNEMILGQVDDYYEVARIASNQNFEAEGIGDLLLLRPWYFTNGVSLATATGAADRLSAQGGTMMATFHGLPDTTSLTEDWAYADFQSFVAHCVGLGLVSKRMLDAWTYPQR